MRGTRLILLDHGVDLLHAGEGLLEDHLRHALVGHGLRVVRILGLPVLARPLHLLLHLRDGGRRGLNLLVEVVDGLFEVGDLGLQAGLHVVGLLGRAVVFVELVDAPVAVLDLVLLLPLQLNDHLVNLLLDLREGIQLRPGGQQRQFGGAGRRSGLDQDGGRLVEALLHGCRGDGLQERVDGLVEVREGLVFVQDFDGVLDGNDLLKPVLDALVELSVAGRALLLQVGEEGPVEVELGLRVLELLESLRVFLLEFGDILVELRLQGPAGHDLRLLGALEGGVVLAGLLVLGLCLGDVLLEVLLHLLQHAEDLAALRRVALEARDLQEGRRGVLGLQQEGPECEHVGRLDRMSAQLHHLRRLELLGDGPDLREAGVVLAQDGDGLVASLDGLDEVDLLRVELLVLLHAEGARLLQRRLILVDLVQRRVTLSLQLIHLRRGLAQV
mmetsp:Transcript_46901/g.150748  ORF Transcript_46901/g.150748 Transcript_46901/m.150748 type:complete len:443 (-) Transcript_46901:341-1669(-)